MWWTCAILLCLDIVSKQYALGLEHSVNVMPGLAWTQVHNHGVAFGLFAGLGSWFHVGALMVFMGLIYRWYKTSQSGSCAQVVWALLVAGALGNSIDRIFYGYVIDFIDVYYGSMHWYVFNCADVYLSLGVAGLLWLEYRSKQGVNIPTHS